VNCVRKERRVQLGGFVSHVRITVNVRCCGWRLELKILSPFRVAWDVLLAAAAALIECRSGIGDRVHELQVNDVKYLLIGCLRWNGRVLG
jgi:hypothetical protein